MIAVGGYLQVEPSERAAYLEGCHEVVRLARAARGCLDFALSPDVLDAGRINVFERWEEQADLEAFRGSGPSADQASQILASDVHQFEVVSDQSL